MLASPTKNEQPLSFSTPIRASSPAGSAQSQTSSSSPINASAVSPAISSSPVTFACQRCNVVCGSQEQLIQHQHLYCMFSNSLSLFPPLPSPNSSSTPNTSLMGIGLGGEHQNTPLKLSQMLNQQNEQSDASSPVPPQIGMMGGDGESVPRFSIPAKKSSLMFKNLLETYGFEVVMQFNEYHQKRMLQQQRERDEDDEEDPPVDEHILQEFPELAKASCPICKKSFSSVWILKAHCEEIHKDVVSTEVLETFAEDFRAEYLKKLEAAAAAAAEDKDNQDELMQIKEGAAASIAASLAAAAANSSSSSNKSNLLLPVDGSQQQQPGNPTAPSTPTSSTTPASSADSMTGNNNNSNRDQALAAAAAAAAAAGASGHQNIPLLAQHMNDVQAALTAMAAQQLQHFNPMINPMMMAAQLGMGLPLGLNMNALAAMNLQPPLVPMMMPPPFDHMGQLNQSGQNNSAASLFPQQLESGVGGNSASGSGGGSGGGSGSNGKRSSSSSRDREQISEQQLLQQQQAAAVAAVSASAAAAAAAASSGQKRARTRITDDQLKILRSHFDINNSPSEEQIQNMAQQSGLPPKVIKHWFRNTLFKERQRNKDSPYNFNNPPSTTLNLEEYEKTGEAKVIPLPPEEQKKYIEVPLPSNSSTTSSKKEGGGGGSVAGGSNKKSQSQQQREQQFQQQQQQQQFLQQQQQLQHHHQQLLNAMAQQQEALDMKYFNHDNQSELSESESRAMDSEDEQQQQRPSKIAKRDFGGSNSSLTSALQAAQKNQRSSSVSSMSGGEHNPSSSPSGLNLSSLVNQMSQDSQPMLPPPKMGNFATPNQVGSNQTSLLSLASPVALSSPGSVRSDTPLTTPPLPSGGGSSGGGSSGKRANRTRFTDYQIKVLQEFFENNAYPKDDDLEYLSKLLSLSPRVIVVWFQNARQKARKVYENQPPLDQQEEGTGRFQRTPGLNYQCKKCLLVFQRYYELIRHQKTHCYKEEDAKRSAQAQAAAAQVAAAMSSEDSNSSTVTDANSLTSSCGPSPAAPGHSTNSSSSNAGRPNPSQSPMTLFNSEMKAQMKMESQEETFQCDKCNLVFPRFDLWREHQLVHIMNPNLFPSYSPESPFGILQHHAQQQQQQQQSQLQQPPQSPSPSSAMLQSQQSKDTSSQQSHSAASSIAGDATAKRKWSADEKSDDDKDETGQQRDKRLRTTILPEQLDYLYQKYQVESNPSRKMLETIAREVGLKKRVVQVWFQNTRARERKGQFRAHAQVINKRCPFCPALFKVKSALETHLAAKHADQYTKGDINIDALPDEELDSASSPLRDNTKVPISFGASTTNSLGAAPSSPSSTPSNLIAPFLHSLSTHAELESSLKKLYEESLKRYAQEVESANQQQNGRSDAQTPTDLRMLKAGGESGGGAAVENPLDLSKPMDLSRAFGKLDALDAASLMDNDYLSDGDDFDTSHDHDSSPNSPASSTTSERPTTTGPAFQQGTKRYRTQLAALQVKVMKNLFADYKTPTMAECEMLGKELGLVKRVIQVWFQNARAKEKKSKLAILKASSSSTTTTSTSVQEEQQQSLESLTSTKPAEECTVCGFKYSHRHSIQDHIFTKKHIELIKSRIESGTLDPAAGSSGTGGSGNNIVSEAVSVQGQSAKTAPPVNRKPENPAPLGENLVCVTQQQIVKPTTTPDTQIVSLDNNTNSEQDQEEHEQNQADFLQQLQLLQLATNDGPTTFCSGRELKNKVISANNSEKKANTATTTVTTTTTTNQPSNNTLSPEDLLQLYGLSNLADGGSVSSASSTSPAQSTTSVMTTASSSSSSSANIVNTTFSSLVQHPFLSNAASALSSSSSSTMAGK